MRRYTQQDAEEGEILDGLASGAASRRTMLRRIAEALHIQIVVLYGASNVVAASRGTDADPATDAAVDQECAALLDAFRRIHDPEERRRLLALARGAAKQT